MTKTKTPLLSLDAHGTIANQLTFQKRGGAPLVRTKPTPSDPKTLKQMYQRWEVQDYIAYWQTLSDAQKLVYFRAGAKNHRTPVAEFLKGHLSELPDIVARYRLDTISGSTVFDSSKNAYHGTVFGASLTDGVIDKALHFDGIDDYINVGVNQHSPLLTFECFAFHYEIPFGDYSVISSDWQAPTASWQLLGWNGQRYLRFYVYTAGGYDYCQTSNFLLQDTWQHIAATYNGTTMRVLADGLQVGSKVHNFPGNIKVTGHLRRIGRSPNNIYPLMAILDHVVSYNRVLTDPDILRHSNRRYPL